jgi:tetratricopeptide (TPR) repeat protein
MIATWGKLGHLIALTSLLIIVTIMALAWSSHGFGYPNPGDTSRPIGQLSQNSARDRDIAVTRFLLLCLDSLSKGVASKAIENCSTAISLDLKNVTAYKLRGNAYLNSGHDELAVADFSRAIQISPKDPEAYRFRAVAYAAEHRDPQALADYDHAIVLTPNNPLNFQLRGYFYQLRNNYRLAIADFTTAIVMQPRLAAAWNSRCWTQAVAGIDLEQALTDCNRSLALLRSNANTWDSLGLVLLRMGRYRASIASYAQALLRNPRLASSLFGRAVAKIRINDLTAARDASAARIIDPGVETKFLSYGIRLRATGPSGT